MDVSAVIGSCTLAEARFLLDHFMSMAINKVPGARCGSVGITVLKQTAQSGCGCVMLWMSRSDPVQAAQSGEVRPYGVVRACRQRRGSLR